MTLHHVTLHHVTPSPGGSEAGATGSLSRADAPAAAAGAGGWRLVARRLLLLAASRTRIIMALSLHLHFLSTQRATPLQQLPLGFSNCP